MIKKLSLSLKERFASGEPVRLLFVCYGNICRSPMAEYVMKDLVTREGIANRFEISSAATSREEIGHGFHSGTARVLRNNGIPSGSHHARQVTYADYSEFDALLGMDSDNVRNMIQIFGDNDFRKCTRLLEFCGRNEDIGDPWYTGNFEQTFADVTEGCKALLTVIIEA